MVKYKVRKNRLIPQDRLPWELHLGNRLLFVGKSYEECLEHIYRRKELFHD